VFFIGDQSLQNLGKMVLEFFFGSDSVQDQISRYKQTLLTEESVNNFLYRIPPTIDCTTNSVFDIQTCAVDGCTFQCQQNSRTDPVDPDIQR
jgi:hypothetical protein